MAANWFQEIYTRWSTLGNELGRYSARLGKYMELCRYIFIYLTGKNRDTVVPTYYLTIKESNFWRFVRSKTKLNSSLILVSV
jgi:hypothetical protein